MGGGVKTGRIAVGGATVDLGAGVVRAVDGRETVLRPKTAEMLRTLASRRGKVLSKDALFDSVWPGIAVVEDNLVQCVSEIRAALGGADRGALRTLPKRGYVLDAAETRAKQVRILPPTGSGRVWVATALGGAAVFAVVVALRGALPPAGPVPAAFDTAVAAEAAAVDALHASVLVLPFEDLSERGDLGHFADGMTEDLIAELSRWREVRVIARNSANTFRGQAVDVREAAAAMGVRYVLEGSVRRVGDRLRLTAQLIDGATGQSLWADRFDEIGPNILALQESIIARLLQTLIGTHGAITQSDTDKAWRKATVELDEYDFVLRGHDLFYRYTKEDNAKAIEIWRAGRRKFPRSGLLAIKEGWGHIQEAQFGYVEDTDAAYAEAARLADEGLRDPELAAAGLRFGLWLQVYVDVLYRRDYAAAVRHASAVTEAFPFDTEGLFWMADMMNLTGELELSRQWVTTALARDRAAPGPMLAVAMDLAYLEGRYEDAVALSDRIEPLDLVPRLTLAASLVELGRLDEARNVLDAVNRDFPGETHASVMSYRPYRDPRVNATMFARLAEAG